MPPAGASSARSGNAGAGAASAGHGAAPNAPAGQPAVSTSGKALVGKKSKAPKAKADPSETEKLLAAKINQLELDAAGEKDQEQEIEREVRKATRDLNNLLAGMGTPLERMEALQKRIADLMADMKRVEREHVKGKKRGDALQKERDAQRVELTKANTVKEKLEKLAREFTKENKKLKEDVKRLEENERRIREDNYQRDSAIVAEHQAFMEANRKYEPAKSHREIDAMFREKFKSFFERYNLRELHFLSVLRAKDNEIQHHLARLESQKKVADSETSRARQLTSQVSTFSQTETELRSQLNIYVEKFKQVEDTLNNSNDLFLTFRKEMEEMSKKTKRLEKENLTLTRKQDLTNRNILEMAEERTKMQRELGAKDRKITTLESIIRHMQEQGRDPGPVAAALEEEDEDDEDGTESEYDSDEDDGDASSDAAAGDEGPEEAPPPPPPPPGKGSQPKSRTYQYPPQRSGASSNAPVATMPPPASKRGVNGVANGTTQGRGSRRVEV